jgi:hypothetical protein
VGRFLAAKLTESLGQQVIVENRAGAGGTIGVESVIRTAPDGYTLLLVSPTYTINPSLYPLKFDPLHDFTPVILVARGPYMIAVHPSLPARTTRELIALAKARPGQIIYGSSGQGTIVHLSTELFLYMAGIRMTHVPYKGGGPALVDLIAGHIQLVFATTQTGLPQAKMGRIRALAVTTPERVSAALEIPTIAESGVPGLRSHQLAWAHRAQRNAARGCRPSQWRDEQNTQGKGRRGAPAGGRRIACRGKRPRSCTSRCGNSSTSGGRSCSGRESSSIEQLVPSPSRGGLGWGWVGAGNPTPHPLPSP